MLKFYTYITKPRLNLVDFIVVLIGALLFEARYYTAGILVLILGAVGASLFQNKIQQRNEEIQNNLNIDKLWKQYAASGETIKAVKEHRRLHGSSFREAVDIVRLYQAEVRSCANRRDEY